MPEVARSPAPHELQPVYFLEQHMAYLRRTRGGVAMFALLAIIAFALLVGWGIAAIMFVAVAVAVFIGEFMD